MGDRQVIVGTTSQIRPEKVIGACYECDIQWASSALAHCAACHRSFSADSAFDRHRKAFACRPPQSVGLVWDETRKWWRYAGARPAGLL